MHRNSIKYKDVWAAPGSTLHKALTDKDMELAERVYRQCEKEARELVEMARYRDWPPKGLWDGMTAQGEPKVVIPGVLRGPDAYALAKGEPTK